MRRMLRLKAVVLGFTGALVFTAGAQAADAAWRPAPTDYSVLRGSTYDGEPTASPPRFLPEWPVNRRWSGFYVGGQIGRSWTGADFSNATKSQVSYILANTELQSEVSGWQTLPRSSAGDMNYGGFVGYNFQWTDAITGIELNYQHLGKKLHVQDSIGPILVAGADPGDGSSVQYSVAITSQAAVTIRDIMTARARFAWAAGRWLPYAFVGAAVGNLETASTTILNVTKAITPPPVPDALGNLVPQPQGPFNPVTLPRNPQSETRNWFAYGYTAGLGLDVAITSNLFLRAEWEYVQFMTVGNIRVNTSSVHTGIGIRF
jgi:opacity protein-like surface antigen